MNSINIEVRSDIITSNRHIGRKRYSMLTFWGLNPCVYIIDHTVMRNHFKQKIYFNIVVSYSHHTKIPSLAFKTLVSMSDIRI